MGKALPPLSLSLSAFAAQYGVDLMESTACSRASPRARPVDFASAFCLRCRVGSISEKNLRAVALELGEALSAEEIRAMIDEFDGDQDGEINAEEFQEIMKQSTLS